MPCSDWCVPGRRRSSATCSSASVVPLFRAGRSGGPRRSGGRPPISTAPRFRTGASRGSASRATPACACSIRRSREHGWQSTHTIVEIVNDDHAVPRRLGDDGSQSPRPHAAPHRPSDRRGAARARTRSSPTSPRPARRTRYGSRSFSRGRPAVTDPARLSALATDVARVLEDVRMAVPTGRR